MLLAQPFRLPLAYLIVIGAAVAIAACGGTSLTELAGPGDVRCEISLSPDTTRVGADGGTVNVTVTSARECEWTASADVPWAQLRTRSGQGSGTIAIVVASSQQGSVRTAAITVGEERLELSQAARPCAYTLTPAGAEIGTSSGRLAIAVTTLDGCSWQAVSSESWVNVPAASRTGSGTAAIDVAANPASSAREAVVTIGGQAFTIAQRGTGSDDPPPSAPSPCAYTIAPAARTFDVPAGAGRITVTTGADCEWTASSNAGWATIGTPSGTGNGEVQYWVQSNIAPAARTATITIAGRPHVITQNGCTYATEPSSQVVRTAGDETRFKVVTQNGCPWSASTATGWISITAGAGFGPGEVTFSVQPNNATEQRSTTIAVGGQTHRVTQPGVPPDCSYTLNPTSASVAAAGGASRITVVTQSGCFWTAAASVGWIVVTSGTGGTGQGDIFYSVEPNTGTQPRSGAITAAGQTHSIVQSAP